MRLNIENALKNARKTDIPSSTLVKVDDVLRNLEHRKGKKYMGKRFKVSAVVAAAVAVMLVFSTAAFGQGIVRYVRTAMLGDHAVFITPGEGEITEAERQRIIDENQELIDAGTVSVTTSDTWEKPDWLTYADAEEGKSHFITDALLPAYVPEGYEFSNIFYYVESMEDLQEYGANMYMGAVYAGPGGEISMQIRFMNEETGFVSSATADMQKIKINGHEAVLDKNTLDLLIGDVMYMFYGNHNAGSAELVKMAESLS